MSSGKLKRSVQESEVEKYFVEQVELHGGMAEKFNPPPKGRPDRIVTWPAYGFARVHFVELKTIGGKLESWQERDHARRRKLGCHVFVIWTKKQVDDYVARFAPHVRRAFQDYKDGIDFAPSGRCTCGQLWPCAEAFKNETASS